MLILGLQKTTLLDYPGHLASTMFTGGCNFRCPYCHNGDLVLNPSKYPRLEVSDVLAHLSKRKNVLDGICITGGEPTLQSDLIDFIYSVKALNLKVKLDTNGTNPDMLLNLLKMNLLDYVAMDIKHSQEKYNLVSKMPCFDLSAIEKSVDILKQCSIDYEFRTTVAHPLHTVEDMKSIGQWLHGCKAYYLQNYKQSDQVIDKSFSPIANDVLSGFVDAIIPYVPSVKIRGMED